MVCLFAYGAICVLRLDSSAALFVLDFKSLVISALLGNGLVVVLWWRSMPKTVKTKTELRHMQYKPRFQLRSRLATIRTELRSYLSARGFGFDVGDILFTDWRINNVAS